MPTPATTQLPRPRSWDEFENIVVDTFKSEWGTPTLTRHGRQGQAQQGVDISGRPGFLNGGFAGIQCKATDQLTFQIIEAEVKKAQSFKPPLKLFVIATTAPSDSALQEKVRCESWPFAVELYFWDDLSLMISGHETLLEKHFPVWIKKRSTAAEVVRAILQSRRQDYIINRDDGQYTLNRDTDLQIRVHQWGGTSSSEYEADHKNRSFHEDWTDQFPDKDAYRNEVEIYYRGTRIYSMDFVWVDGYRHLIPMPETPSSLAIDKLQYKLATILDRTDDIDDALQIAGIRVVAQHSKSVAEIRAQN